VSGALKQAVRAAWRWTAYQPLFSSTEGVYVKGRLPDLWMRFYFLPVMMTQPFGRIRNPCDAGVVVKLFEVLNLLLWVLAGWLCACIVVDGYRTWRYRTTVPEGKKPWFSTRLVEGAATVRRGLWFMFIGVISMVGCVYVVPHRFHQIVPYLFNMPSASQNCQAPQQHPKTVPAQGNSR
jgi:hypothetical protein